ncbi:MAG: GGDEF domain-containing protein [Bacilli bacterium]|nr:GGDEF domain-containing protein [Bacilli bacterium]
MINNITLEAVKLEKEKIEKENKKVKGLINKLDSNNKELLLLDPLTNFLNQKFLHNYTKYLTLTMIEGVLLNEINNTNKHTFSLLFCDIDGLKLVNDTMGHQAGDEGIIAISEIIHKSIRTNREELMDTFLLNSNILNNIAIRSGGDEFIIILPNCTKEMALVKVIKRIKNNIKNKIDNMSLSIGVVDTSEITLPKNLLGLELIKTFNSMVRIAEERMYEDKNKNMVQKSKTEKQKYVAKEITRIFNNLGLDINNKDDVTNFYNYLGEVINKINSPKKQR